MARRWLRRCVSWAMSQWTRLPPSRLLVLLSYTWTPPRPCPTGRTPYWSATCRMRPSTLWWKPLDRTPVLSYLWPSCANAVAPSHALRGMPAHSAACRVPSWLSGSASCQCRKPWRRPAHWLGAFKSSLAPYDAGRYLNFSEERFELTQAFRPDTVDRLRAVKERYDPGGLFHANPRSQARSHRVRHTGARHICTAAQLRPSK